MNTDILRAYHYFRAHGERAEFALALARAEAEAEAAGCTWDWLPDPEGAAEWYCDCGCQPDEVYGCVMRDHGGHVLASRWSIGDPDGFYIRYVQAELSLEALDALTTGYAI